jgi:hypothetical protein
MHIMVTGSRDWNSPRAVEEALAWAYDNLQFEREGDDRLALIHGGARGADRIAANFWEMAGLPTFEYKADWEAHGKRAGILRNEQMIDSGPRAVLAFWKDGSPGTRHAITTARARMISVYVWWQKGPVGMPYFYPYPSECGADWPVSEFAR